MASVPCMPQHMKGGWEDHLRSKGTPSICLQACPLNATNAMQAVLQAAGHVQEFCEGDSSRVIIIEHTENCMHILQEHIAL